MKTYHVILVSTHSEYDITVDESTLKQLILNHTIEETRNEEEWQTSNESK